MKPLALFLFDYTTTIAKPWRAAGFETISVDIEHPLRRREAECLNVDLTTVGPLLVALRQRGIDPRDISFMGCFPVCTHVAVCNARDFRIKGLRALAQSVEYFATCQEIAGLLDPEAVWFVENPVSSMASHWRKPDYYFSPEQFTSICRDDNYTKKTSLWTSENFIMPEEQRDETLPPPDDRIHKASASIPGGRAAFRSAFPVGFSKAVCARKFWSGFQPPRSLRGTPHEIRP